jgi:hypothetical protein
MIGREPRRLSLPTLGIGGLTAFLFGCGGGGGDTGPPPTAAAIAVVAGAGQTGQAGAALPQPIVAHVTSASGAAVEGATVNFAVGQASGTVAPAAATTDGDGKASANWTLGTTVGSNLDTVYATVSGVGDPALFTASVTAAAAARLEAVSGDAQAGIPGQQLAQPLVVIVRDAYGNPRSQVAVAWTLTAGGGSITPDTSTSGADGQAAATWTPGSDGDNIARADIPGLDAAVTFHATAQTPSGSVTLTAVTPTPLVEGQPAILTGTGFNPATARNQVKVDGIDATVSAASATSLTIVVPTSNCRPARTVPVQIVVGNESSNVLTQALNPAGFLSVPVGQEVVLQDPAQFCLQFAPASAPEDYLVGVQSTSEVVTSLTPVTLTSVAAPAPQPGAQLSALSRSLSGRTTGTGPSDASIRSYARRRAAEAVLRAQERQQIYPLLKQASSARARTQSQTLAAAIPATLAVGDTVPIRYPGEGNLCTSFVEVRSVVRVVGTHGIWLEDVDNPEGGLTPEDIQRLSDEFDTKIYTTVTDYFGSPTDIDNNQRIAVVLTRQVNKIRPGVAGHVGPQDLVPRSLCPSSDEGEIYYGVVPDPAGTEGDPLSRDDVTAISVQTIAHEFTHIIQLGQRFILHDLPPHPVWVMEGQAMLAEEITGYVYEGRSPGHNYGFDIAFNQDDPSSIDWYSQPFVGLLYYYGFRDRISKVPHAPEECSWLAAEPDNPGPCLGGLDVYGAPWALFRWMADQFGTRYPNGEKGLHQALILSPATGYEALAAVSGVPLKTLLAQWAAMLYVDDRITGAQSSLTLPSWNLLDVANGLVEAAQLVPRSRGFNGFSDAFNVRAGSSAYLRVSGTSHPGTAIRVRNGADGSLPAIMQVFIVRLQ